jgi:hypothetical protein
MRAIKQMNTIFWMTLTQSSLESLQFTNFEFEIQEEY